MPLIVSVGVLNERVDKLNAYWDLVHEGDKWIYAKQDLRKDFKQILIEEEMKVTFNLPEKTRVIPMRGRAE